MLRKKKKSRVTAGGGNCLLRGGMSKGKDYSKVIMRWGRCDR